MKRKTNLLLQINLVLIILLGVNKLQAQDTSESSSKMVNEIGLNFSSTINTALVYKLGIKHIYGVAKIGTNYAFADAPILSFGAGTRFQLTEQSGLNIEASYLAYLYDDFKEEQTDKGISIDLLYERTIAKQFKFNVGPSVGIIENNSKTGFEKKSLIEPLSTFDMDKTETGFMIGFGASLIYSF